MDTTGLCYCGHDCSRCITFLATKHEDGDLREQSRKFYQEEFGRDIPLADICCSGGRSENIFILCRECPFRECCRNRGLTACGDCPDYPCGMLADYMEKYINRCNQFPEEDRRNT